MINVTKAFLPPLHEYVSYLNGVWERGWLTNYGPLVQELEEKLKSYLGVKHLFFVNNGTIALQIAIKALDLKGEVITTPFSYVATTSSLVWQNCKPVFADIDGDSLCIDPELIEQHITARTEAILATHVYGNPCAVEKIEAIAAKHKLRVIYDAAHAFGVECHNKSLLSFGDISTISFHATKLYHTGEGGALVTNDDSLAHKLSYMANFGHNGPEDFFGLGINGKNSELHAALGLCMLPMVNEIICRRAALSALYDKLLNGLPLRKPIFDKEVKYNFSYYPIIFTSEKAMLGVKERLNEEQIFPRRYFYPALTNLNYISEQSAPIAEDVASRVLCLPLYFDLEEHAVSKIASIIKHSL